MPQDAFTLRLTAKELNAALTGGRINRINQPEREELSFIIYTGKRTVKLTLNANAADCGAYFTEDDRENPLVAPNFCMLLRKHLQGAQILGVEQVGFERILALRFLYVSDFSTAERVLYAEIMGKYSNLLLTEKGVILGALKTTSADEHCKRLILPGAKYTLPEPQDKVNRVLIPYLHRFFIRNEEGMSLHEVFRQASEEAFRPFQAVGFGDSGEDCLSFSLYETVETIIDRFGLKEKAEDVPYLIAFQDMIYEYEANNSNNISLFLEWWDKEKDKRVLATSEEADAVRILTIHKSKGLEFEYVILPFCSWELDAVRPVRRIWCRNREAGFDALEYAPLNYSGALADTLFRDDYFDEHLKAYIDNLNLLYVAFTRAKNELYVRPYLPKENKDGSLRLADMGAFIWQVLGGMGEEWQAERQYIRGRKQQAERKKEAPLPVISLSSYPVWQPEGRIAVKYRYRDYTSADPDALSAIDEGKLLHEIFKSIRHLGDVPQAIDRHKTHDMTGVATTFEYSPKSQRTPSPEKMLRTPPSGFNAATIHETKHSNASSMNSANAMPAKSLFLIRLQIVDVEYVQLQRTDHKARCIYASFAVTCWEKALDKFILPLFQALYAERHSTQPGYLLFRIAQRQMTEEPLVIFIYLVIYDGVLPR